MSYLGSWTIDDLLTFYANTTRFDTGAATDADAVPDYRVYENETGTAILTGSMALLDSTNTAGFYSEQITLSAANGFEKGKSYAIYISATVNSVAGATHHTLQIEAEVDANRINWANIDNPTTAQNLSGTNIDVDQVVASVSGAVGSVTGAVGSVTGNVGGNVTGSVGSVAANGLSASSLAADAVAEIADGVWDEDATGHQTQGTFGQAIGDPGADSDTIWGLANTNLDATVSSRASQASVNTIDDFLDTEIAAIITTLGTPAGVSISADIAAIEAQTDDIGVAGAGLTAIPWNAAWDAEVQSEVDDALVARFLDKLVIVNGTADSGSTTTMVDAARTEGDNDYWKGRLILFTSGNISGQCAIITDFVAATDTFTFAPPLTQAVSTQTYVILPGISVWDDTLAEHLISGSTGASLNAAGSAGDPWNTALPGAYGAGTAGKIVGDNINATISSRSSHSAADVWAVATRALTDKAGFSLSAAGIQAIWDALTSALTTAGSIGKLLVDNVNATISSRSSHSAADVWAVATRLLTAGTNIVLAKGVGVTGFNDLSAAQVNAEADTALSDYDAPTHAELVSEINSVQSDIAALNNLSAAQVNAEVDTALADVNLDHLVGTATGIPAIPAGTYIDQMMDDGTAVYDRTTDSLQAIRDRGDAAWTTATGFSTLTQADVRTAVGLASANLDTQLSTIDDFLDTEIAAIKAKTDQLTFTAANKVDATIQAAGDFAQGAADKVWSTAARILTAGTNIVLAKGVGVTGFNDVSTAQVNAEVVDALATDTYAEPGQGTPAATATLAAKINYLYKSWRNKKDNDGSTTKLYADDTTTVDQKQTTSEAAGTVTKGEWTTGP